jgi:hypothetical protein
MEMERPFCALLKAGRASPKNTADEPLGLNWLFLCLLVDIILTNSASLNVESGFYGNSATTKGFN